LNVSADQRIYLETDFTDDMLREIVEKDHSKNAERRYAQMRKTARIQELRKKAVSQILLRALTQQQSSNKARL